MKLKFHNKKITGILAVVPDKVLHFDDEMQNYEFSVETSIKLKKTMGYDSHRIFDEGLCISDVAVFAMEKIFSDFGIAKDSIDALILVTETPDYLMPPTSNVIQGRLGLKEDMICLDINQGCAGFEIGLIQAFMMLEQEEINRVALINGDMLSRKTSKRDRNSYPLIGDALAVTIIDKSEETNDIYANVKMDGSGCFAIQIPAGGLRLPCSSETAVAQRDAFGNWRSQENLVMKGDEVFMFVQKKVPPLIREILEYSGKDKDEVEFYMFHQPNQFMVNKLASSLKVAKEKMPANIVGLFGNSSSVTVPLNIAYNIGEELCKRSMCLCMAGFGVGLVWSSILMNVGPLQFCSIAEIGNQEPA